MAGCGTVAVETVASGRDGLFTDIDPLSSLITRAKCQPVDPDWLVEVVDLICRKAVPSAERGTGRKEALKEVRELESSTAFRVPPKVFHWFSPYVVVNLCRILRQVDDYAGPSRERDAILATFASVIRRVSRADPSTSSGLEVTRVRLRELKLGLHFDVARELKRKALQLAQGYREMQKTSKLGKAIVVQEDAKNWSSLCQKLGVWPDLVITSPCYMSAIEYWRRHKLEYCLLGLVSPEELPLMKQRFLGMGTEEPEIAELPSYVRYLSSKLARAGKPHGAKALERYFGDTASWLLEVLSVLERTKGTAYVVVAANTNSGVKLNTPLALRRIAERIGLSVSVFMRYEIKNSYMQYPTKSKRIKTETVLKMELA